MPNDIPIPIAQAGMTFGGDNSIPSQYYAGVGIPGGPSLSVDNSGDSPDDDSLKQFRNRDTRHPVHKLADMGALHLITQVLLGRNTQDALNDYKTSLMKRKK